MAYITNTDIEERLGTARYIQLTDDTGSGAADVDKIDEARLAAEGEVNSYLARRYAVPIDVAEHSGVADVLKSFVLDLVEYRLYSRRPPIPDDLRSRRDHAVGWLQRVAAGLVILPSIQPIAENPATGLVGEGYSSTRIFSRDELRCL